LPTSHLFDHHDHDEFFDLPIAGGGEPNQSAGDFRTITRCWHSRTGITSSLLHLSTTTELVVLNLIPQHDPHPDSQFARNGGSCFSEAFLDQFTTVKLLQRCIPAHRMDGCFTPKEAQQRIALFA
jgi:hypothetical protein